MRMGLKRSVRRSLLLMLPAIVAAGLLVVPSALAATSSMALGGLVNAKYYAGQRAIPATVTVPDPTSTAAPLATGTAADNGFFIMLVPSDLTPPTYSDYTVTASALKPVTHADWSSFFTTGSASFEYADNTAAGVSITLVVKNTTVSGTVYKGATKKKLAGVKVAIGKTSAKTSKQGVFTMKIGLWPATKYQIKFSKKGYKTVAKKFTSNPGGSFTFARVHMKKK